MKEKERQASVQLNPVSTVPAKLSWAESYQEMANDSAGRLEWIEWDALTGDGLGGLNLTAFTASGLATPVIPGSGIS